MIRLFIIILFLAFAHDCLGSSDIFAQNSEVPFGWKKVSVCQMSFLIPKTLKNRNAEGTDSCIAVFSNSKTALGIDYGWYGSAYKINKLNKDYILDFKEETIKIDGKDAQFATFIDTRTNPKRNFIARIYVVLDEGKNNEFGMKTSLNMKVAVRNEKEFEIAKQIFQSIRFDK